MGLVGFLFLKIPDLGTMLVLGVVGFVMYRYAGGKLRHLLFIVLAGTILGGAV